MVVLGACCPSSIHLTQRSIITSALWRSDGSWQRIRDHLVQWVRVSENRAPSPSAASLDSQSVASAVMVNEAVGYDGGKKLKGRKRFTLVDTLGLLIAVRVVAANVPHRAGAKQLLDGVHQERHPPTPLS